MIGSNRSENMSVDPASLLPEPPQLMKAWNTNGDSVEYMMGGEIAFDSPHNRGLRDQLSKSPGMMRAVDMYWKCLGTVEDTHEIAKDSFVQLCARICKVLCPDVYDADASASARIEWKRLQADDVSAPMTLTTFTGFLLRIATSVTMSTDECALKEWLSRLFKRVFVRVTTTEGGDRSSARGVDGKAKTSEAVAKGIAAAIRQVHAQSTAGTVMGAKLIDNVLAESLAANGFGSTAKLRPVPHGPCPTAEVASAHNCPWKLPSAPSEADARAVVTNNVMFDSIGRWLQQQQQQLLDADYADAEAFPDPFQDEANLTDKFGVCGFELAPMNQLETIRIGEEFFQALVAEGPDKLVNQVLGRPVASGTPPVTPRRQGEYSVRELKDIFKRILHSSLLPSAGAPEPAAEQAPEEEGEEEPDSTVAKFSVSERLGQHARGTWAMMVAQAMGQILDAGRTVIGTPAPVQEPQNFNRDLEFVATQNATPTTVLVLAPPGSGGSTLAKGLCATLGAHYLGMSELIQREIDANSELGSQAQAALLAGQQVERSLLLDMLKAALVSLPAQHGGWVLDGFPLSEAEMDHLEEWNSLPQYIVEVSMADSEVLHRRLGLRIGGSTGQRYSEAHTQPELCKRLAELYQEPEPPKPKSDEEEEPEPEEEEEDPDAPPKDDGPIRIADMGKLLLHPRDARSAVLDQLEAWHALRDELAPRLAQWHPTRHLKVSGVQSAEDVLAAVQYMLRHATVASAATALVLPEGCEADDDGFAGACGAEEVDAMVSLWGRHCPVTLHKEDRVVVGKPELAALYLGRVWMCADEAAHAEFLAGPSLFLGAIPQPKLRKVVLFGPPCSGKTAVAAAVAARFGWEHVSASKLLEQAVAEDSKLSDKLRGGGVLDSDDVMAVLTKSLGAIEGKGWVLDGMPMHQAAAQALAAAPPSSTRPDLIVCLADESSNEDLIARAAAMGWEVPGGVEAAVGKYAADWEAFQGLLTEAGAPAAPAEEGEDPGPNLAPSICSVSCNGAVDTVVANVARAIDPFVASAVVSDISEAESATDVAEGDPTLWGDSGTLCPVALAKGQLRHGLNDFVAKFKGRYYKCGSEEALNLFVGAPELFTGVEREMPPARVLVLGPPSSGKQTLSAALAAQTGASVLNLSKSITAVDHGTLAVSNEVVLSELKQELESSTPSFLLGLPYLKVESTMNEDGELEEGEARDPSEQITQLLEGGVYFDAVVVLAMDDELAVSRLLVKPTDEEMEAKRVSELEDPAEDDEKTEEELDEVVAELKEAEIEARSAEISEKNTAANDAIEAVLAVLEEKAIPVVRVAASLRPSKLAHSTLTALGHLVGEHRSELLARAASPPGETPEEAAAAVETSISKCRRSLSKFGRGCPVASGENRMVFSSKYSAPVLYLHHVYFPLSSVEAELFKKAPKACLSKAATQQRVNVHVFVVGAPGSGKSTVASEIARQNRAQLISMTQVLNAILAGSSALREALEPILRQGKQAPDEMLVQALVQVLGSAACACNGWVVDGFPTRFSQVQLIEDAGIVPQKVFCTAPLESFSPTASAPDKPLTQFEQARAVSRAAFEAEQPAMQQYYTSMHSCWHGLDASHSKFARSSMAVAASWDRARALTLSAEASQEDKAMPAEHLGLTPMQIETSYGPCMDYCPVTLIDENKLCKTDMGMRNSVMYRGRLYKTRSVEAMRKLLAAPVRYLYRTTLMAAPLFGCLPVPMHKNKEIEPLELALAGHCPVTLSVDPTDSKCVVPGHKHLQIRLGGFVYRMLDHTAWRAFLEQPWKYSSLELPTKMPAEPAVIDISQMPARGYCEQTVSQAAIAALNDLVKTRPKYPGLTPQESVTKFLALHLKGFNPALDQEKRDKHQKVYEEFVDICGLAKALSEGELEDEGYVEKMDRFERIRQAPWEGFL